MEAVGTVLVLIESATRGRLPGEPRPNPAITSGGELGAYPVRGALEA